MCTRYRGSRDKKKVMNSPLEEDLMGFLGMGAKFDLMRKRGGHFKNPKHTRVA